MRLATFNLENLGTAPEGSDARAAQITSLRPQIERLQADVLCLQEVNAGAVTAADGGRERALPALDALLDGTPYADFHRIHTTSPSGPMPKDRHNLVTLSRFRVTAHREIHHHLIDPPRYRRATASFENRHEATPADDAVEWDRPLLHTAIDAGYTRPLHVINLHLRAPRAAFVVGQKRDSHTWKTMPGWAEGYFLTAMKRAGQALEARLFIDDLFDADADALIAVAGDFNADDYEVPARIIRGDDLDVGNAALSPRMLVPLDRSLPEDQRRSVIHAGRAQMLDHVFASRALSAFYEGAEVLGELLGDEVLDAAAPGHAPGSFHAPVVARFRNP